MPKGGKREGAGRKPGYKAKVAEAYNAKLAEMVKKDMVPIIEALITRAKTGDTQATKEIHERLLGKVAQPLANDKDNPLLFTWLSQSPTNQESGQKPSTPRVSAG